MEVSSHISGRHCAHIWCTHMLIFPGRLLSTARSEPSALLSCLILELEQLLCSMLGARWGMANAKGDMQEGERASTSEGKEAGSSCTEANL